MSDEAKAEKVKKPRRQEIGPSQALELIQKAREKAPEDYEEKLLAAAATGVGGQVKGLGLVTMLDNSKVLQVSIERPEGGLTVISTPMEFVNVTEKP